MITENKMRHCLSVAQQCKRIAITSGKEELADKMFIVGYLHDIGYEFIQNGKLSKHPELGANKLIECLNINEFIASVIKNHGNLEAVGSSLELDILNIADFTVDSLGNKVTTEARLEDIKRRYGVQSENYKEACRIVAWYLENRKELVDIAETPLE